MNVNLGKIQDIRAIVTGYAYESVANAPIRAGQTSGNAENNGNDAPRSMSLGMLAGGTVLNRNRGAVKSYDLCRAQSEIGGRGLVRRNGNLGGSIEVVTHGPDAQGVGTGLQSCSREAIASRLFRPVWRITNERESS